MRAVRFVVAIGLLYAAASCGGKASVNQASAPPCETRVPAAHPADTLTIVVFDKIDLTHAPWPQNRSERFVFSHLYQTLVNIDCYGVAQPGIAKSWKKASDGWYIEIQEDAHFWDDKPVTADDVKTSFQSAMHDGLKIQGVDVVDETHAIIHGTNGVPDISILALPILAIRKESNSPGAPLGTGPWRIKTDVPAADGITLCPSAAETPLVRFIVEDSADAMDLLNGPVDAMITDDDAVLDYARTKSGRTPIPLDWDGVYVLLSTSRSLAIDQGKKPGDIPRSVCDGLARDAVSVDARGGSRLVMDAEAICQPQVVVQRFDGTYGSFGSNRRIVFDSWDATSRGLAERLVSLAAIDTTSSTEARAIARAMPGASLGVRAIGIDPARFEPDMHAGNEFAYITRWSWCSFPVVWAHVPDWLLTGVSLTPRVIPLVETRSHFLVLTDHLGFTYDKMGNVHLIPPGVERVR